MLSEFELGMLHKEYFDLCDKIREMERKKTQIDLTINENSKQKVASRFIPLEFGDKIRVTKRVWVGGLSAKYETETREGFFGSWVLDGHQYTEDNGEGKVKLRLYQIKKDGTRSQKSNEFFAGSIINIEKVEG